VIISAQGWQCSLLSTGQVSGVREKQISGFGCQVSGFSLKPERRTLTPLFPLKPYSKAYALNLNTDT